MSFLLTPSYFFLLLLTSSYGILLLLTSSYFFLLLLTSSYRVFFLRAFSYKEIPSQNFFSGIRKWLAFKRFGALAGLFEAGRGARACNSTEIST
jgi:hypothetical protein